jgi:butyryl-CoA dehydrogenase
MTNPLLSDRDVDFLLYEVLDAEALCALPAFAGYDRATFDLVLGNARRLAREVLFPAFQAMDAEVPRLVDGRVRVHPRMRAIYPAMVAQGFVAATRPASVGGAQLPHLVSGLATAYLMAGNAAAYAYLGLTTGAAHLIEAFGSDWLRDTFMRPMYDGAWTGTMALTEPHAGSSLGDITTRAIPQPDGSYRVQGSKVFISGGDHDLTENIVHLVLARVDGAPAGVRGVSLFAVPRLRPENGALVPNDAHAAGVFHKMGWRGLPSIALNLGDEGDCHGWLVGPEGRGLACMFQMMNEARIMVGMNGAATAAVAYQESLAYAQSRTQGRALNDRAAGAMVPIIEHADVRRMLLRQKAIVEGAFALLAATSRYADLAAHAPDDDARRDAQRLLDLLTPVAKSFPAERGFESNALAVQIHGGYGYTSEYLPEAWLRDQKLNSIHEGTTGIQAMDLLGRKVMAEGGAALMAFGAVVGATVAEARVAGVAGGWCDALASAVESLGGLTMELGMKGAAGDRDGMLRHATDYLDLMGTVVVAWQWLAMATAATRGLAAGGDASADFYRGKLAAARYWYATELPRAALLTERIREADGCFAEAQAAWF